MEKFHFVFEGEENAEKKDWGCKVIISGTPETIGKLMAGYARVDAAGGNYDLLKILITAFEIMRKDATVERNGIIRPMGK